MSEINEGYLIAFGALGWLLTLYFGFFRFKHYLWARRKVQYDLFTKINQNNNNLFLKVTTLTSIKDKNKKISAKRYGVLIKYVENCSEKIFLIRGNLVSKEIALFWVNGMIDELKILAQQDEETFTELEEITERKNFINNKLDALFGFIKMNKEASIGNIEQLYTEIIK